MTTITTPQLDQPALNAPAPRRASPFVAAILPAFQWRLSLLWLIALVLPTLVAALPMWRMLASALDHSTLAAGLAQRLDLVAVADLASLHTSHGAAIASGGIVAVIFSLLLSPLLTGAAITAARAPQRLGFAALVAGGVQEYGRLVRMLVWAVVPLGLVLVLGGFATGAADKFAAGAAVPAEARLATWAALGVTALLFVCAHATLDAGRAVLALDRRRRSAVLAWVHGLRLLRRRPLATFGVWLGITVLGLALAALLSVARINTPPLGIPGFVGALLLTQFAVLVLAWMRCARLFALMAAAREAGPGRI